MGERSDSASSRRVQLLITNMHCPTCCEAITQLLSPLKDITDLSVDLLHRTVTFEVLENNHKRHHKDRTIAQVVEILATEGGYHIAGSDHQGIKPHLSKWRRLVSSEAKRQERLETKEQQLEASRRAKHLERCEICQEEERNKQDGRSTRSHISAGPSRPRPDLGVVKTTLSIEGMTCASCTGSITSALKEHPDISKVEINLLSSSGLITHISNVSSEEVAALVEDLGFEASVVASERPRLSNATLIGEESILESTFMIEGMTCASCSSAITKALQDIHGIKNVSIDVLGNKGVIAHSDKVDIDTIRAAIEDVGYDAEWISTASRKNIKQSDSDRRNTTTNPESRTVNVRVKGIYCSNCITQLNSYLAELPLLEYTPLSMTSTTTAITYIPQKPLTIRTILGGLSNVAPEFEAEVVKTQSLSERSQKIQKREVKILASHLALAITVAIPTFIIAIVGMILLPSHNELRMKLMEPVWGAANLGTVILWPLATLVQFGVGRLFYRRALHSLWPHLRALVPSFLLIAKANRRPQRKVTWRSFFSFGSMDLLVSLSTTVSYFASIAMLIIDVRAPRTSESVGTYFDSSVFLIMFILLGRTLEAYAKLKTNDAISLLGALRPDTALLVSPETLSNYNDDRKTRSEESIPTPLTQSSGPTSISVDHLERGDLILIPPGSLPPTDGIVVYGTTTFDESSLTGESKPIKKSVGDELFTGTTNLSGAITIRVTNLGGETMLSKIISAVADASGKKAPIEKFAEKLTGVFVPIIVYLSILVLIIWLSISLTGRVFAPNHSGQAFFAIEFAVAVLVVACPCGIGLAVPCAIAVGNGMAAKAGILPSGGGEAWVAGTKVSTVVFDKTGTLTIGKSTVTDEVYLPLRSESVDDTVIQGIVAAVEQGSTHPLASGLVDHLKISGIHGQDIQVTKSDEIRGRGIAAEIKVKDTQVSVIIGNLALMHDRNVTISSENLQLIDKWSSEAKSVVLVAIKIEHPIAEYHLAALYSLSDPPRDESATVIKTLDQRGIRTMMLSGDNGTTANAIVALVGIRSENVRAGVGPEGKAEVIREIQQLDRERARSSFWGRISRMFGGAARKKEKETVMFIGDGLNDSVALAAADVSVAMGHGSQATLASADFVLLSSSLTTLPTLLNLSRKIKNRQILNLVWALLFNAVCLPFAAGVFYPAGGIRLSPVWSAVLMALSSVSVVVSSLALRWGL